MRYLFILLLFPIILFSQPLVPVPALSTDSLFMSSFKWRCIGPERGGRSAAVTGSTKNNHTYYFGSTGGGVWKSNDGGNNWTNISDGFFGGSIGAVSVSESDPDIIYVGEGEETVRGNVSEGHGMWKSSDAGRTWTFIGLADSRHITRIRIHPKNPDIVYVSVLGHLFGQNEERGVYKTIDGGKTWNKILFSSNTAGAIDLIMEPGNPRTLYASTWKVKRTPYSLESGGKGSALWKSSDAGETWKDLSNNEGFPKDTLGIICISVCPSNPKRIYASIEAVEGGIFRSDDSGETWEKVSDSHDLRQRAWYFSRIYADPKDENIVYSLNVEFHKSTDGGRNFKTIGTPHGDHHDLWINPDKTDNMIIGDDGGAQITFDGGQHWSSYHNQPTAQFYRVSTDNHTPYRILAAQQDNSSVRIKYRSQYSGNTLHDWESTAGGECGYIVADPLNDDIVYGGNYDGYIERQNHRTGESRNISVWPDNPIGWGAGQIKYRFQWNFPMLFSPNDPHTLYAAGNVLFKTTNEGQSWEAISPDLTRNDTTKMHSSGGPITKDNTSVVYYGTIFTVAESAQEKGLIWTGSDDGLIYITKDGGKNWQNVTPPFDQENNGTLAFSPAGMIINCIEVDPFTNGGAYFAGTNYKYDNYEPYIYRTKDYGQHWMRITNGIEPTHFTRVVRADPSRQGLLYCGTEHGMYISFNDGADWKPFQQNLPIVPITDLTIKNNDLIAATQGRSFWIIDDLTPLHKLKMDAEQAKVKLFTPRDITRHDWPGQGGEGVGQNPPEGLVVNYYIKNKPDTSLKLKFQLIDPRDSVVYEYVMKENPDKKEIQRLIKPKQGMNRLQWNLRYPDAKRFEGIILWSGGTEGPMAATGKYHIKMFDNDSLLSIVECMITPDPLCSGTADDYIAQFNFSVEVHNKINQTHGAIEKIRNTRKQINDLLGRIEKDSLKEIRDSAKSVIAKMTSVEEELYQTKNKSGQDPINYPIKLNDKLCGINSTAQSGCNRPSAQVLAAYKEIADAINVQLQKLDSIFKTELSSFNELVAKYKVPAIVPK